MTCSSHSLATTCPARSTRSLPDHPVRTVTDTVVSATVIAVADTVLIGDTPNDVKAALAAGARIIAVATGSDSGTALAAAGATIVLHDLADTEAVVSAVTGAFPAG